MRTLKIFTVSLMISACAQIRWKLTAGFHKPRNTDAAGKIRRRHISISAPE